MKKGKLVVIDGLDGSGKKTQLDLLVKYCREYKIAVAAVDFPQYYQTFFGRLVGRYLKGEFGGLKTTNPYLAGLTFAGDRWQAKEPMIKALKKGRLLLANRYTSSSQAFMAAKFLSLKEQDKYIRFIEKLEKEVYQCPKEDLVVYLDIPPLLGQKLVLKKGQRKYIGRQKKQDIHEENLAYLKRVAQVYLRLAKRYSYWVKISCLDNKGQLKTKKQINQEIIKVLIKKQIF